MISTLLNISLVVALIIIIVKHSKYKKLSEKEFQNYEERLEEEMSKIKEAELLKESEVHYLKSASGQVTEENYVPETEKVDDSQTVKALIFEIENIRKEKEEEMRLRLEAEKQIELAIQKTKDVEQRVDDWKVIQSANLKDATNTIMQVGNDLYQRLVQNHKLEVEDMRNQSEETVKDIHEYLKKIAQNIQFLGEKNIDGQKAVSAAIASSKNNKTVLGNFLRNLEEVLVSSGFEAKINYFMHTMIPEEKKKLVPCESFIAIDDDYCIIVDIKSRKYFKDLSDSDESRDEFKQKIDRYINYLSNPKYKSNIISYFSSKGIIEENSHYVIILLVDSDRDVDVIKELGEDYLQILDDNNIELHSLNSLSDLILDS